MASVESCQYLAFVVSLEFADKESVTWATGCQCEEIGVNTDAMLSTNRYLLDHGHDNSEKAAQRIGVHVIPPVFIHPEAEVESSVIGPYATVEAGCQISGSIIQDSIVEKESKTKDVILRESLIGQNTTVSGGSTSINVGDNTEIEI